MIDGKDFFRSGLKKLLYMGDIAGHQIYVIDDECLFLGV